MSLGNAGISVFGCSGDGLDGCLLNLWLGRGSATAAQNFHDPSRVRG